MKFNYSEEVSGALHFDKPIVALESTVISHGLPHPQNLETALRVENIVRETGALPATIAMFGGDFCVGLNYEQMAKLANGGGIRKISTRDLSIAVAKKLDGATTVATTSFLAHRAGLKVFATGGIGGVHRSGSDVSADLPMLARTPIIVVCSGAKIVLDLSATREWLETNGVTVLGWQCDEMPAFYARSSGLPVDATVRKADEVGQIAETRNALGLQSAILVVVPVPEAFEMANAELEDLLSAAQAAAANDKVTGKEITPFLLSQLSERSGGKTLAANIALLENNARVAAEIATRLNY